MGFRVVAISSSGEKEAIARELGAHEYVLCGVRYTSTYLNMFQVTNK